MTTGMLCNSVKKKKNLYHQSGMWEITYLVFRVKSHRGSNFPWGISKTFSSASPYTGRKINWWYSYINYTYEYINRTYIDVIHYFI